MSSEPRENGKSSLPFSEELDEFSQALKKMALQMGVTAREAAEKIRAYAEAVQSSQRTPRRNSSPPIGLIQRQPGTWHTHRQGALGDGGSSGLSASERAARRAAGKRAKAARRQQRRKK